MKTRTRKTKRRGNDGIPSPSKGKADFLLCYKLLWLDGLLTISKIFSIYFVIMEDFYIGLFCYFISSTMDLIMGSYKTANFIAILILCLGDDIY
jgi:hypothetical protein